MTDDDIVHRIGELVEESRRLRTQEPDGIDEGTRSRLRTLEVMLDQCWDLLRNRRAREEAGNDPDEARARPAEVVESYQQ